MKKVTGHPSLVLRSQALANTPSRTWQLVKMPSTSLWRVAPRISMSPKISQEKNLFQAQANTRRLVSIARASIQSLQFQTQKHKFGHPLKESASEMISLVWRKDSPSQAPTTQAILTQWLMATFFQISRTQVLRGSFQSDNQTQESRRFTNARRPQALAATMLQVNLELLFRIE